MTERSLLQSIREKELEASVGLDAARREAAELVEAAKSEAAAILERVEQEAARAAEEYLSRERERISLEAGEVRHREMEQVNRAAAAGEKHLEEAAERITAAVIPEETPCSRE